MTDIPTITFCVLTKAGQVVTLCRIGLSAAVAEVPDAVGVWRVEDTDAVMAAIKGRVEAFW